MLYIASDHAGFKLKEKIKYYLTKSKIQFKDLGTNSEKPVDYPDYAKKLIKNIKSKDKGILICGTGTGMVIAANRSRKIRAAVVYDNYTTKMARHDNDANVICLRGRKFSPRKNIKLVKTFLNSDFSNLQRHKKRIKKLSW